MEIDAIDLDERIQSLLGDHNVLNRVNLNIYHIENSKDKNEIIDALNQLQSDIPTLSNQLLELDKKFEKISYSQRDDVNEKINQLNNLESDIRILRSKYDESTSSAPLNNVSIGYPIIYLLENKLNNIHIRKFIFLLSLLMIGFLYGIICYDFYYHDMINKVVVVIFALLMILAFSISELLPNSLSKNTKRFGGILFLFGGLMVLIIYIL